ncbi:hypothetical protein D3C85_1461680 [compost metagenome]
MLTHKLPQYLRSHRFTQDYKRNQPLRRASFVHQHHSLADYPVLLQYLLDLPELDPETTELHLLIHSAQKLQVPARQQAHTIARAI